jgi:hypothetical protein
MVSKLGSGIKPSNYHGYWTLCLRARPDRAIDFLSSKPSQLICTKLEQKIGSWHLCTKIMQQYRAFDYARENLGLNVR